MNKNYKIHDDGIDLIAIFKIILEGKIKILFITIISILLGFGYTLLPQNYLNSLSIDKENNYQLIKFDNIERLLKINNSIQLNEPNAFNQIVFLKFIDELQDYEEFLFSLKNTKKIKEDLSKLKTQDQDKELYKYSKLFNISYPKQDEQKYIINFIWHDPVEAKKILQDTINLTSKNLKKEILDELNHNLEFQKKLVLNKDRERLSYLNEQSSIAKELNISDNQINNVSLYQSININTADYLRGYKAIDKEIELIQNRDYQNFELIKQEIDKFKDIDVNFVKYNIHLMESKSPHKNYKFILIISILLGLMAGMFFVLISDMFQSETISKKQKKISLNKD